jgi:hypothetical protein
MASDNLDHPQASRQRHRKARRIHLGLQFGREEQGRSGVGQ